MVGVIFYFEENDKDFYSGRGVADFDIWRMSLKAFGANAMIIIDNTAKKSADDYKHANQEIVIETHKTLDEALKANSKEKNIYLETKWTLPEGTNASDLKDFDHPKDNVIYILGQASGFREEDLKVEKKTVVYVPQVGKGAMWPVCVMSIVLYDRARKLDII